MRPITIIMTWIGMTLLLTSVAAILWSTYAQRQQQHSWHQSLSQPEDSSSASSKRRSSRPPAQPSSHTKEGEKSTAAFARLYFPRLDREVFVFSGDTPSNLAKGPAWLTTTGFPGKAGNSVIAGHRDTHFRFLKDVRNGDEITVDVPPRSYHYRVRSMQVVEPSNVLLLKPDFRSVLTLVTCYPFTYVGLAPRRFIIRAELSYEILAKQHSK